LIRDPLISSGPMHGAHIGIWAETGYVKSAHGFILFREFNKDRL